MITADLGNAVNKRDRLKGRLCLLFGMAAALSKSALGSTTAALPATVFSIWMDFSGSVLANYWRKKKAN